MIKWFWKLIGELAFSERGFRWLVSRGIENPYSHIIHSNKVYMFRYWILGRNITSVRIRLHRIMKPDTARDMHSHPFNFRTIILRGWYVQELPGRYWPSQKNDVRVVKMSAGDQARARYREGGPTSDFHRITQVSPGGCWTLFIMWGGKRHDWGFMTRKGYVPAADYVDSNGAHVENV